jgi:hypothetical protein
MRGDEWNWHLGSVWAELLRNSLPRNGSVVEIGPGFSDKIGLALAQLGFSGTLYVVEPTSAALRCTLARYAELLPSARLRSVPSPFQHAFRQLPVSLDALLLNHVLDDLFLCCGLSRAQSHRVFSTMRPGRINANHTRGIWGAVLQEPQRVRFLRHRVATDLRTLVSRTNPRFLGICQYDSWTLKRCGLSRVNQLAADFLQDFATAFMNKSVAYRTALLERGQDPSRWLVCDVISKDSCCASPFPPANRR